MCPGHELLGVREVETGLVGEGLEVLAVFFVLRNLSDSPAIFFVCFCFLRRTTKCLLLITNLH